MLHRISWYPYNEAGDLIAQAEKYKSDHGCCLEHICADHIYINIKNRHFCKKAGIRLSGKRLGRTSKDQKRNAKRKQQLLADKRGGAVWGRRHVWHQQTKIVAKPDNAQTEGRSREHNLHELSDNVH